MQLSNLLSLLGIIGAAPENVTITGISNNSKMVKPGHLFIAISGHAVDGHDYVDHAISLGAAAIIGEEDMSHLSVPYIQVANSRMLLAYAAKHFYYPQNTKTFIGVTGTNGKTTTAFMLKHIFEQSGKTCSLFSSVYNEVNGDRKTDKNTTSDSLELYKQLAISEDDVVILEVTSHALIQHRVAGIAFDCCVFTNLSQDHLDYHVDMNDYFNAKGLLFQMLKPGGTAIINTQNDWGKALADDLHQQKIHVQRLFGDDAGLTISEVSYVEEKMNVTLLSDGQLVNTMNLSILGEHNAQNATMAFAVASAFSLQDSSVIEALEHFKGAPGRFVQFKHPNGGEVIIDYAHTEDAFFHSLTTARNMGARKIIHLFGFRGNRDTGKRQSMINVSLELSDLIILTLDDLNNESPEAMKKQLEAFNLHDKGIVILDRIKAIKQAWSMLEDGDWLFITGKGQEPYQLSSEQSLGSDYEVVESLV